MKHSPESLALVAEARARIKEVAQDEVLDVREKAEFAGRRVDGAINVGRGVLEMRVTEVVPDRGPGGGLLLRGREPRGSSPIPCGRWDTRTWCRSPAD